jgi:hypothetical protein
VGVGAGIPSNAGQLHVRPIQRHWGDDQSLDNGPSGLDRTLLWRHRCFEWPVSGGLVVTLRPIIADPR